MLHCCKVVGVNYDSIMDVQLITFVIYYLSREVFFYYKMYRYKSSIVY